LIGTEFPETPDLQARFGRTFVRVSGTRICHACPMGSPVRSAELRRRGAFAYWVSEQELAGRNVRAAIFRAVAAVVALAAFIRATVVVTLPEWTAALALFPLVAVYLALREALYAKTGHLPVEPLARWACRVGEQTRGGMTVNVSGIAEAAGAVCLGALGGWAIPAAPELYRLTIIAATAAWFASFVTAIMVDHAWYNPALTSWPPLEYVRAAAGVIAAVVMAAVELPAPWPGHGRAVVAAICVAVATLQFRVREADRVLASGAIYAGQRDMDGRRVVTTALHTLVGNQLIHLKRQARSAGPEFFDLVRQLEGGYRETLALDRGVDVTMDWPGVLASRLDAIAGQYGINVSFSAPSAPMAMPDREVARFVLDDLTENAAKAGAGTVTVDLHRDDGRYLAVVSDDGPGLRAGAWMRDGGGLQRLQTLLHSRGGGLEHSREDMHTVITASWQAVADYRQMEAS
jgi:hypothetical protein